MARTATSLACFVSIRLKRPEACRGLGADEEGPTDAHQGERPAELVNRENPVSVGVLGALEGDRVAVDFDGAAAGRFHPGEDLDQGGLTSAVVA